MVSIVSRWVLTFNLAKTKLLMGSIVSENTISKFAHKKHCTNRSNQRHDDELLYRTHYLT